MKGSFNIVVYAVIIIVIGGVGLRFLDPPTFNNLMSSIGLASPAAPTPTPAAAPAAAPAPAMAAPATTPPPAAETTPAPAPAPAPAAETPPGPKKPN